MNEMLYRTVRALDLPMDTMEKVPRIVLYGTKRLVVDNHRGILEYNEKRIRLRTMDGQIILEGARLFLTELNGNSISVEGYIHTVVQEGKEEEAHG
ncbi:sporulation protein YqfC [Eubacteriales bacterium OttesenSCG-928-M02]|nr:sporulation protein YqfC [Eubacteriales bacterium OttesenSCG-928-M02]